MKYIEKIEIDNFFGKRNICWDINEKVNILGGKNGSGKSTIFKSCYALLTDAECQDTLDQILTPVCDEMRVFMNDGSFVQWIKDKGAWHFGDKFPVTFSGCTVKATNKEGQEISLTDFQNDIKAFYIDSFEQHLTQATQYDKQPKTVSLKDPTMLDLMILDQIHLRNTYFAEMMEKYADDEDNETRISYIHQYKNIYLVLMEFLEGYDEQPKSKFQFTKDGKEFGYERLSMGEKQILLLLLMVGNTNGEKCIFFMDEPDLSMHIDWKERLVTALHEMNPQMQILLSTHAPSVITGWIDCVREMSQLTCEDK